jgi:hypothetical protein
MVGFFPAALAAPYLSRLLALPGLAVQWLLEALAASMHSPLNHSTPPAQSLRAAIANIRNPLNIAILSAMNPRSFKAHINRAIEHSGNQHLRPAINSILLISPSRGVRYVDSLPSVGPVELNDRISKLN